MPDQMPDQMFDQTIDQVFGRTSDRTFDRTSGRTSDRALGHGPPLVLLHGFTGAPRSFHPLARSLHRHGHRGIVLAISLPGHHPQLPVRPGFAANIDHMASILLYQIGARGASACHLLGYSLGARTALGLAVRHPELVSELTLIGVHPGLADADQRTRRKRADDQLATMLRTRDIEAFVDHWQDRPIFASQSRLPSDVRAQQRRVRLAHDPQALADSLTHMGLGAMPDYRADFAQLAAPVTLITGAEDAKFTHLAQQLVDMRPGTAVHSLAGCGHNPVLETPDQLAEVLGSRLM